MSSLFRFCCEPYGGHRPEGDVATFAIQEVIDAGAVPKFLEFLQRDHDPTLQLESAWVLTMIASGASDHTQIVVEKGAVPIFVRLLMSPDDDICERAVSLAVDVWY